uniref:Uncharacterized protein n=1 Tax=Rhizophora mucronata TaxID=61149 RepID=A0A2P2NK23_RHIMU
MYWFSCVVSKPIPFTLINLTYKELFSTLFYAMIHSNIIHGPWDKATVIKNYNHQNNEH